MVRIGRVWSAITLRLAMAVLVGCSGDGSASGGGGSNGGTSGSEADIQVDLPCGQVLDCGNLCDGDQACQQGCIEAAYPHGRELYDALDACVSDSGCQGIDCQSACTAELDSCEADVPPGGRVCVAEGIYEVCADGWCEDRVASGAGWGVSDFAAQFWGVYDCTDQMLNLVAIATLNAESSIKKDCAPTTCQAN